MSMNIEKLIADAAASSRKAASPEKVKEFNDWMASNEFEWDFSKFVAKCEELGIAPQLCSYSPIRTPEEGDAPCLLKVTFEFFEK